MTPTKPTIFTPPLYRNGVEITSMFHHLNAINVIVHVVASSKEELETFEVKQVISKMVCQMVLYLEMEGYIEGGKGQQWLTNIGFVLHPPGSDNFQNA